jgi:hypothetical protein
MTTSITKLWTAARAMFERVRGAADIVARALSRHDIEHMRARLRPLEALVRKIVLIEAMALAREPARVTHPRLTHRTSTTPRPRAYALRLWPRTPPPPARIRQIGPPLLVRDIFHDHARAAMMRRLNMARAKRPTEAAHIARRISALERLFAKPIAAVRRLARKLNAAPNLALTLAAKSWPRSPHADRDAQIESDHAAYAGARHFKPDSS